MTAAEQAGKIGDALQAIEDEWNAQAGLKPFGDAVVAAIKAASFVDGDDLINRYLHSVRGKAISETRAIAKALTGVDVYWDWDAPRTREGYYRYQGGCPCAINRAVAYAPYADLLWMESKLPDYKQAKEFADGVHDVWPEQKYVGQSSIELSYTRPTTSISNGNLYNFKAGL